MLLADREIREAVAAGRIGIDPWEPDHIQPASVDVRLGREFQVLTPGDEPIDPRVDSAEFFRRLTLSDGAGLGLEPGEFALATTYECITLPDDMVARVEGRSSLARLGLAVHATAGFIDPGWHGAVTFELSNVGTRPIILFPGMRVAQVVFEMMTGAADVPYGARGLGSHYQGQSGPTLSRIHERFTYGLPPVERQEAA